MPVYQYACTECGEQLEVRQSFSDDPLTVCPACSGRLRKVLSAVGVVFKGSGFYRTDSRATSEGASKEGSSTSSGDGAEGSSNGSSTEKASTSSPSSAETPASAGTSSASSGGSSAAKAAS